MSRSLYFLAIAFVLTGCGPAAGTPSRSTAAVSEQELPPFQDEVETNAEPPTSLDELVFVDTKGQEVRLSDSKGKENVVLVFTRGFSGMLCPLCTTQTSRLISNYDEIQKRDARVLLVYPGDREHLEEFIKAAKTSEKKQVDRVPFPILLDEDLAAVKYFDIVDELAHPSTYIIDKEGKVRFAYVGTNPSDRPSVKALLQQLDNLAP